MLCREYELDLDFSHYSVEEIDCELIELDFTEQENEDIWLI